jgi:hypothetical protein
MSPCRRVCNAIVCTRGAAKKKRCYCGNEATLLCDWKPPRGKTCDAPICRKCSYPQGDNLDYCRHHVIADGPGKDSPR